MTYYKVIGTITWQFESDKPYQDCMAHIKQKFGEIISEPHGQEFDDFGVQVELVKMKDKKKLVHLAEVSLDEIFPYLTPDETRREYRIGECSYHVKMNSDRYFVFNNNRFCVSCGIEGTKMILDMNFGDCSPHFNLYAEEKGRLILMTKDHILAKSKGGKDDLSNYATCCSVCNNLKGHYDLNYEQVKELRRLYSNPDKLPHKELRDLINKKREKMIRDNLKEGRNGTMQESQRQ